MKRTDPEIYQSKEERIDRIGLLRSQVEQKRQSRRMDLMQKEGLLPAFFSALSLILKEEIKEEEKEKTPSGLSEGGGEERAEEAVEKPEESEEKEMEVVVIETKAALGTLSGTIPSREYEHTKMESAPFERGVSSEKYPRGVTLCSKTAWLNLKKLGFNKFFPAKKAAKALSEGKTYEEVGLPSGDAHDVRDYYMVSDKFKKFVGSNKNIIKQLEGASENTADVIVKSSAMRFSHRAVAFKSSENKKWYIMDPYVSGSSTKPMPIEQYKGNILMAVPLIAPAATA